MRLCGTLTKFRRLAAGGDGESREPKNNVVNKQECWPSCGVHRWGTWGEGVGLRLDLLRGHQESFSVRGTGLTEKCARRNPDSVCFGAVWEFLRDTLGLTDTMGAQSGSSRAPASAFRICGSILCFQKGLFGLAWVTSTLV